MVCPFKLSFQSTFKVMFIKKHSKNIIENFVKGVSENVYEVFKTKTQDVDFENLTQTLDYNHAYDKPPREDSIEYIFCENIIETPIVGVSIVDIIINEILDQKHVETQDSSDGESQDSQGNVIDNVVNTNIDKPYSEDENLKDANLDDENNSIGSSDDKVNGTDGGRD